MIMMISLKIVDKFNYIVGWSMWVKSNEPYWRVATNEAGQDRTPLVIHLQKRITMNKRLSQNGNRRRYVCSQLYFDKDN